MFGQSPAPMQEPPVMAGVPMPQPSGIRGSGLRGGRSMIAALIKQAQKAIDAAGISPPPVLKSEDRDDSTSRSVPGGYSGDDLEAQPKEQTKEQKRTVDEVMQMYRAASGRIGKQARFWEYCRRFAEGEHFLLSDDDKGIYDQRFDGDKDQENVTEWFDVDYTTGILEKIVSFVTQNEPDVTILPKSMKVEIDRQAATEGRLVVQDCNNQCDAGSNRDKRARRAITETTAFEKVVWDKNRKALLPVYDPQTGELAGAVSARVGGVSRCVVPGSDLFFDPSAQDREQAQWVIHASVEPLSYMQETYGKVADVLKPDTVIPGAGVGLSGQEEHGGMARTLIGSVMDVMTGGSNRTGKERPNAVLCIEVWHKPCRLHPKGRFIVVAGGRLIEDKPFPYEHGLFPFVATEFAPSTTSPYGPNLVSRLIDLQATVNKEWSRILSRLNKEKRAIVVERLSNVGADAFEDHRDFAKIYYDRGSRPPQYMQAPPISAQHFEMMDRAYRAMQEISGMVDVLSGKIPAGVTSGYMLETMVQNATSIMRPFIDSIRRGEVDIAEQEIALYAQFATEERLLGLSESKPGQPDEQNVSALKALSDGGQTRVTVSPDSGVPKSVAGQNAMIADWAKMGLFGPLGDIKTSILITDLMTFAGSDRAGEALRDRLEEEAGQNDVVAQAQQMIEQQQAQIADLEKQLAGKGLDAESQMAVKAAELESKQISEAAKEQASTERELAKIQMQAENDSMQSAQNAQLEIAKHRAQAGTQVLADVLRNQAIPPKEPQPSKKAQK